MSKPSWDEIPKWANWMWIGAGGYWLYSYKRPRWDFIFGTYGLPSSSRWGASLYDYGLEWNRKIIKSSLERRP